MYLPVIFLSGNILTLAGWGIVPLFQETGATRKVRDLVNFTLQYYSTTFTLDTLQ